MLTDVDGILSDGRIVDRLDIDQAREILKLTGNGMDKKIISAMESIEAGTHEVIIANGNGERPLTDAINSEKRTVITK